MKKMNEDKPFWNWFINFLPVRWFINLPISKKVMKSSVGKKLFNYEMVTYIFFGVLTTALNLIIFYLFDKLLSERFYFKDYDMGFLIANVIAWVFAMLFAFVTNKLIVFKSKDKSFKTVIKELNLFAGARLASLAFEEVWLLLTVTMAGYNKLISKIIANLVVVIMNYFFSKFLIFKKQR